jgi:hypothetical protein
MFKKFFVAISIHFIYLFYGGVHSESIELFIHDQAFLAVV